MAAISSGTLRMQDLIPRFAQYIEDVKGRPQDGLLLPADDDHPWWDSDEAFFIYEELIEELEELAPPGTYFGSHEGDGALFGFWEYDE